MSGQEKANKTTARQRGRRPSLLPAPVEAVLRFGFSLTLVLSEYEKLRSASGSRAASAGSDAAHHVTASALLTAVDDAVRHSSFSASSQIADDVAICHEFAETSFAESPSCDCADDDSSCQYTKKETHRQNENGAAATTTTAMCPPRDSTTSSTTGTTTDFAAAPATVTINPLRDGTTTPSTTATTTNITAATTTAAMSSPGDGTAPLTTAMATGVTVVTAAGISLSGGEASSTATVTSTAGVPVFQFPGGRNAVCRESTSNIPAASDPNRDATQEPSFASTPAVQHSQSARDRSGERRDRTSTRDDEPGERSRQVKRLRVLRAENRRLKARRMCRQCLERPVSLTLLPCGHFLLCQECGSSFTACPVCRKTILADVRTFVS